MLKLLLCLFSALALAAVTLQLRQQRLEISYEMNQLHNQIEARHAKLWNQQLSIAINTAPNAISHTVSTRDLNMIPQSPLPGAAQWLEDHTDADAE